MDRSARSGSLVVAPWCLRAEAFNHTDIHMPGSLDGLQLARHVHARWPGIKLLIASGRVRPDPEEIPDSGHFVAKPYEPKSLVQQLRELTQRQH